MGIRMPLPSTNHVNTVIKWLFESFGACLREDLGRFEEAKEGCAGSSCAGWWSIEAFIGSYTGLEVG